MKLLVVALMLATLTSIRALDRHRPATATPSNLGCPHVCTCTDGEASQGQTQSRMAVCTEIPTQKIAKTIRSLSVVNGYIERITKKMTSNLGSDLTELDLSNCHTQSIEPGSFDRLTKLVTLRLSDNQLKAVDAAMFKKNSALQELHLDGNKLHRLEPSLLTKLDRLRELHLERNQLDEIPAKMPLGLARLNVSHNNIANIADTTDLNEVQLKTLDLCGNPLQSLSAANLRVVHQLQQLCLGGKAVELPGNAAQLMPHLSQLSLRAEPESQAVLSLANQDALRQMAALTSLTIVNYHTSSLSFLRNMTTLSTLKLEYVTTDSMNLQEIFASKQYLTRLNFDNSPILAQHLSDNMYPISQLPTLQVVSMRNAQVTRLVKFPMPNKEMKLDLSGNPLHCDCGMGWFQDRLSTVLNPQHTLCSTPDEHQGRPLVEVLQSLHCADKREEATHHAEVSSDQHAGVGWPMQHPDYDWTTQSAGGDRNPQHGYYGYHDITTAKTIHVETNEATDFKHRKKHHDDDHAVVYIVLGCFLLLLVAIGIVLGLVYWYYKKKGLNKVGPDPESTEPPLEPTFQQLQKASEDSNLIATKK